MSVKTVNSSNFKEIINSDNKLILIDFWAEWCGPCKMLAPVLDRISEKYSDKLIVAKLNTDDEAQIAQDFAITSIPCCIFFKNGNEVQRVIGFKSESDLEKEITHLI